MTEDSKLVDKLQEETNKITFEKEEMDALSQVQTDYLECQNALGQIQVQKINLQQQIDNLSKSEKEYVEKYQKTQETERNLAKTLQDKYGDGTLDPQTGVFTPNS